MKPSTFLSCKAWSSNKLPRRRSEQMAPALLLVAVLSEASSSARAPASQQRTYSEQAKDTRFRDGYIREGYVVQ